jgi:hypothetical protein
MLAWLNRADVDFLYPPNLTVCQAHLDTMRVMGGARQKFRHHPLGEAAAALVRLEYNGDCLTRANIAAISTIHADTLPKRPVVGNTDRRSPNRF